MADPIDRQVAIAYAISGRTREIDGENWIRVSEVRESIKTLPSAERRGKWIKRSFAPDFYGYTCRSCNHTYDAVSNYCPNCGARMEE